MSPSDKATSGVRWALVVAGGVVLACLAIAATAVLAPPDFVGAYLDSRPISCTAMADADGRKQQPTKLRAGGHPDGLDRFAYRLEGHPRGKAAPSVAIRAFDGWLLGSDRGEFGGELIYRNETGDDTLLARANVEDIYRLKRGYIVTTGRGTLESLNGFGHVLVIGRSTDGVVEVVDRFDLPAAPKSSWLLPSGEVLVSTAEESVVITAEGVRSVVCEPQA